MGNGNTHRALCGDGVLFHMFEHMIDKIFIVRSAA